MFCHFILLLLIQTINISFFVVDETNLKYAGNPNLLNYLLIFQIVQCKCKCFIAIIT